MKARLLLLLFTFLAGYIHADVTKNIVVSKGLTYTIDPAADLGVPNRFSSNYLNRWYIGGSIATSSQNGGYGHYNEPYLVSDEISLSIVPVAHKLGSVNLQDIYYYTYEITPQKAGSYTFFQEVYIYHGDAASFEKVTYNITVVELTNVSIPASIELCYGDSYTFTPTLTPYNATTTYIWNSNNPAVATVSAEGEISTVGLGTTTITCSTHNGLTAQCELTVSNGLSAVSTKGCKGGKSTMIVNMSNTEPFTAFQYEVVLPEGVSMTGCTLTERKADQAISYSKLANGNYQVTSLSATNTPFNGSEGAIVNMRLTLAEDMAEGNYTVEIKNIELSTASKAINPGNISATLTVTNVLLGDTDGNGKVSIFDAVQVVNYILGTNPAGFVEAAADMDGNGRITIFDAVSIVNVILGQVD